MIRQKQEGSQNIKYFKIPCCHKLYYNISLLFVTIYNCSILTILMVGSLATKQQQRKQQFNNNNFGETYRFIC